MIRRHVARMLFVLIVGLTAGVAAAQQAPTRMPPIPAEKQTEAQRAAVAAVAPNGTLPGYLVSMLRSPGLVQPSKMMADYLNRRNGALPARVMQLPILMVARQWLYTAAWDEHVVFAIRDGLNPAIAAAIAEQRRPTGMAADEQVMYDFCDELLRTKGVSDATWKRSIDTFGEAGTVDTLGLLGYYTYLAMFYNTTRLPVGAMPAFTPTKP
jgi:4-carboxymuconolactone decarboxylase